MQKEYIISIDQGTSGTKTLIINAQGEVVARATAPLHTRYLPGGWVEQSPDDIIASVTSSVKRCIAEFESKGNSSREISSCGISNQRETFVVWDKSGQPLCNAVVWQCKRSIGICDGLKEKGLEELIRKKTGLLIDPYFSGSKLIWLYENDPKVKSAIDAGDAYFGTVDTWLLFRLTEGKKYLTDYTNASRTLFFNLTSLTWDKELLEAFNLVGLNLPECRPSASHFGESDLFGLADHQVAITAMIGDSHAAAFGEGCFRKGTAKATMGTGCSVLMNAGTRPLFSDKMVSTICWSTEKEVHYALEGVIVTCGATLEWLKNELGLFDMVNQTAGMAEAVPDNGGVFLIPAFSGLGAPHWDMSRKGSIEGLTFSATRNHIVRAALESIPFQIKDVIDVMHTESGIIPEQLSIDGGMSQNMFVVRFLADLLGIPVVNMGMADVSALGAAFLAGLPSEIFPDVQSIGQFISQKNVTRPEPNETTRKSHANWQALIRKT